MGEKKDFKSFVTVKNVIRVLSLLCLIFVFCPSFLVSCAGKEINVSVMTAVRGVEVYGETVTDPYPLMIVCILIPIVIFAIFFIKQLTEKSSAITVLACGAVDVVLWIVFCVKVKRIADDNGCDFKVLPWYVINMIVLILIVAAALFVVLKVLKLDSNLIAFFTGEEKKDALNQMASAVKQMSASVSAMAGSVAATAGNKDTADNIGFCNKCGKPLKYGNKFCTACGAPIPESVLVEAEAAKKAAEETEAARNAAAGTETAEEPEVLVSTDTATDNQNTVQPINDNQNTDGGTN